MNKEDISDRIVVVHHEMDGYEVRLIAGSYDSYYDHGSKCWRHGDGFWQLVEDCFPDSSSQTLDRCDIMPLDDQLELLGECMDEAIDDDEIGLARNLKASANAIRADAEAALKYPPMKIGDDLDDARRELSEEEYHDIRDEIEAEAR